MTLVRSDQPLDEIDGLRARLSGLEHALAERVAEITRARTALEGFRIRYRREVGSLHEELDDLHRAIAEAELAEKARHPKADVDDAPSPPRPRSEPLPRFTSDAVRKLFRAVARTIHPDLTRDDEARDRRHALMVEANRAYAQGDEERLRWILDAWESSPEAVQGTEPEAIRQRLLRRIAQIEEELKTCAADLEAMQGTPLWQLKAMVDEASGRGKDLMGEMVTRLKRDILVARNRLDAIQWSP